MRNILFVSYDGLTDPLGQSQILAYLKRLSGAQNRIVILSFEKPELFARYEGEMRRITEGNDIIWIPRMYTKKPPVLSTIKDIRTGLRTAKELHEQYDFDIVHCRGYIPAIIGRSLQRAYGVKFIFDMRGWWPDEKLESGNWAGAVYRPVYRYFKKLEKQFFKASDYIVSLTYKGKEEIERQGLSRAGKIGVIPTCVDFEIFRERTEERRERMRTSLGIRPNEHVFIYSGSVGGNYDPQILVDVFRAYRALHPQSYLLILSKDDLPDSIREIFSSAGIDRMSIHNAPFTRVSDYLAAGDTGFIYYKMSFSTIGRSPTKMGEYWASGLPVIAFSGIGDLDAILTRYEGAGVLLSGDESTWQEQLRKFEPASVATLRTYANDYFSIDSGVGFYAKVYEQLAPAVITSDAP